MKLKLWLKILFCVGVAVTVSVITVGTVHVVKYVNGYYSVENTDDDGDPSEDFGDSSETESDDDSGDGSGSESGNISEDDGNDYNDSESDNETPSDQNPSDNPNSQPDDETNTPESDCNEGGESGDEENSDSPQPVLTNREKALRWIANADVEIYRKFEYFVLPGGILDGSKINMTAISEELDALCESLVISISAKYGTVDKITNEMITSYDSISNLLDDIRNLLIANII